MSGGDPPGRAIDHPQRHELNDVIKRIVIEVDRMHRELELLHRRSNEGENKPGDSRFQRWHARVGVRPPEPDEQKNRCRQVSDDRDIRERYFRYFPTSRQYDQTHAFEFFRLEPVRIRFIGGFGQIFWMEPRAFASENPFSAEEETGIVKHMNRDHANVLRRLVNAETATIAGLDSEGFDVLNGNTKIRVPFPTLVTKMEEARSAFIELARHGSQ